MRVLDPSFKGGVCTSLDEVLSINKLNSKTFALQVLPEYLYSLNYGIFFQKNSPYVKTFNELTSLFKSAGLIDFWAKKYLDNSYLKLKKLTNEPKKMSFDQLKGSFELLLFGCLLSLFAFLVEIIYYSCNVNKIILG